MSGVSLQPQSCWIKVGALTGLVPFSVTGGKNHCPPFWLLQSHLHYLDPFLSSFPQPPSNGSLHVYDFLWISHKNCCVYTGSIFFFFLLLLSRSVMLPLLPHRLLPTRLLCPWDFLNKNILEWIAIAFSGDISDPGIKPMSLAFPTLAGGFFTTLNNLLISKLLNQIYKVLFATWDAGWRDQQWTSLQSHWATYHVACKEGSWKISQQSQVLSFSFS